MNLIPVTTDMATSSIPNMLDLNTHLTLLEKMMETFPKRAPPESLCVRALATFDNYYRNQLSKVDCEVRGPSHQC
jgi:hypothetical protein